MRKYAQLMALLAGLTFLVGCQQPLNQQNKQLIRTMNESEFDYFFSDYISEERPFEEIEAIAALAIEQYPHNADDIIDALCYNTGINIQRYSNILYVSEAELSQEMWDSQGFLSESPNDPVLKALNDTLESRHLKMRKVIDDYVVIIDYAYYLSKYEAILSDEMKAYYTQMQALSDYAFFVADGFDYDVISTHLLSLHELILNAENLTVPNNLYSHYQMLLTYWLGVDLSPSYVDDKGQVREEALRAYEALLTAYPNHFLSDLTSTAITHLETANYMPSEDYATALYLEMNAHVEATYAESKAVKLLQE